MIIEETIASLKRLANLFCFQTFFLPLKNK